MHPEAAMNHLETERRQRYLTAILEAAVGNGERADLARRVAARVAGTQRQQRSHTPLLLAACMLGSIAVVVGVRWLHEIRPAMAPAQDPVVAAPAHLVLSWRCTDEGAPAARMLDAKDTGQKDWPHRQVVWSVAGREVGDLAAVLRELQRLTAAARAPIGHGEPAARPRPLPLVLQPQRGARWSDVVAATDVAMTAGFLDIRWHGVDTDRLVPTRLAAPDPADGAVLVPVARFAEPDQRGEPRAPTFDVHQDGRIGHAGALLFTPDGTRDPDLAAVRSRLLDLRKELVARGAQQPGGPHRLIVPLLVRIDRGTEWAHVQRLLAVALAEDVGFARIAYAVAERDRVAVPAAPKDK
jgi:hypothetical protein